MNRYEQTSIGKEAALALAETEWWKDLTPREIAYVQLTTKELCMDFGDFHAAVEEALGRPVWTHEFAFGGWMNMLDELNGDRPMPTMDEIIQMIPKDKRRIIVIKGKEDE